MNGSEDKHADYKGCAHCASALQGSSGSWNMMFYEGEAKGCPHCRAIDQWGSSDDRYGGSDRYSLTRLKMFQPQAEASTDGALIIKQGKIQSGFYPPGSWVSWRSE
jgi:hypothetical protein